MILKEQFKRYNYRQGEIRRAQERAKRLEQRIAKMERHKEANWVTGMLEPLAKALAEKMGLKKWEIMGPFGLGNETSIWLYNTKEEREDCKVYSLTVRPDLHNYEGEGNPFGITLKDYTKKNNTYAENSIGALNGFNYGEIKPPLDADLDWFISKMSKPKDKF